MEIQLYVFTDIRRTKMKISVYPGSFDPITNGHLDIIKRASRMCDKVIVGVLINPEKRGLLTIDKRVELIERVTANIPNVSVESFSGLLINFMKEKSASIIVKGLRAVTDFEYELSMALMNNKLDPNIETVFMMTNAQFSFLSSSSIKQVAMFGGCMKGLIPDEIIPDVMSSINKKVGR
jgi:pantetheine-phosphate adenylyltransferase